MKRHAEMVADAFTKTMMDNCAQRQSKIGSERHHDRRIEMGCVK